MKRSATIMSLLLLAILISVPTFAQLPEALWFQTIGGYEDELAYCVQQTADGGFIVTGYTYSFGAGGTDICLVKTDSNGNVVWYETFGGMESDVGKSVRATNDGGYIICGNTMSFGEGNIDIMLIKTDSLGEMLWQRTFGTVENEVAFDVQLTTDDGYLITGTRQPYGAPSDSMDAWLIKTDAEGDTVWTRIFGGMQCDGLLSSKQTSDGGYISVGITDSFGDHDDEAWLLKTNANGNEIWSRTFGGEEEDSFSNIQLTSDGGYVMVGNSYGVDEDDRAIWLVRTDESGNELWSKTYGGEYDDSGQSVKQTDDGGFILIGWEFKYGGWEEQLWMIKTDEVGYPIWSQTFGGPGRDVALSVVQTANGDYVVAGSTYSYRIHSDILLLRVAREQIPAVSLAIAPVDPPVVIPSPGGTFEYFALITNDDDSPVAFDAWVEVELPDGTTRSPVLFRQNLTLAAGEQIDVTLIQEVPGFASAGVYLYRGIVGNYPDVVFSYSEFEFEKLPPTRHSNVNNWNTSLRK